MAHKNVSVDQVRQEINEHKKQLMLLRFQKKNSTLKDTSQVRKARRQVARLMTQLCGNN